MLASSQACIPYLKTGKNSHILNISPPLNMNPHWFKGNVGRLAVGTCSSASVCFKGAQSWRYSGHRQNYLYIEGNIKRVVY